MRIRVLNHLDDLADDTRGIATGATKDMVRVVREGIRTGNSVAKDYARQANPRGSHSHEYPASFSADMHGVVSFGGTNGISGEYGPRPRGQGALAPILENGSRNGNVPQNNLAKSADLIGPAFLGEVRRLPDRWFW